MSDWPEDLKTGPIREWPGALRAHGVRERAKFMRPGRHEDTDTGRRYIPQSPMPLTRTLKDLNRELEQLKAKDAEMLVAIPAGSGNWRIDGKPRANVTPDHPGVILSFEIPNVGRVSYPCDKYTRWEDNLRAIVLALEALRLVDRHGVARQGDQYRGYLAIEATATPAGFSTADAALKWLAGVADVSPLGEPRSILRLAQRAAHPDSGGDSTTFQRVSLAEAKLRAEGQL